MRDHLTRVSNERHASVERKLKNFDILLTDYRVCDYIQRARKTSGLLFLSLSLEVIEIEVTALINQLLKTIQVVYIFCAFLFDRGKNLSSKTCFHFYA